MIHRLDLAHLGLDDRGAPDRPLLVIDADQVAPARLSLLAGLRSALPLLVLTTQYTEVDPEWAAAVDVVLASTPGLCPSAVVVADIDAAVAKIEAGVQHSPRAAVTLGWLLRGSAALPVAQALAAESVAYSMLLASSEFQRWLRKRGPARPAGGPDRIRVAREGDRLHVRMIRVDRRNAVDTVMRHELFEALSVAIYDSQVRVLLDAEGPAFSAGGDLDEFGSVTDPATAHLIRVAANVGQLIHDLGDRVEAHVHGACVGAGVEMPSFAARVVAHSASYFALPEISMGLVPGAGGTVSITRRIGRGRTNWMALTGERIDAATALEWGLVDELTSD